MYAIHSIDSIFLSKSQHYTPDSWLRRFQYGTPEGRKALRIEIFEQTCQAVRSHATPRAELNPQSLSDGPLRTVLFENRTMHTPGKSTASQAPMYTVMNADCIDASLWLRSQGLNPVVLNMASARHPGGGVKKGSGAQEENLCRRSNLYHSLADPSHSTHRRWSYPLPEFGGIYSPDVTFFRAGEGRGYAWLQNPFSMSVISVAAYANPIIEGNKAHFAPGARLTNYTAEKTALKINAILKNASENGHDSIVLSAFGCGAFKNPAEHMAQIFRRQLENHDWHFRHVCFAILDDHNAKGKGNYLPFAQVFENLGMQYPEMPAEMFPLTEPDAPALPLSSSSSVSSSSSSSSSSSLSSSSSPSQ